MLKAIEVTATETRHRVIQVLDAMEKTKKLIQSKAPKIYSKDLIDIIFQHPYCKIRFIEDTGLAKRQTAASYLTKLEELNFLKSMRIGKEKYYINQTILTILRQ